MWAYKRINANCFEIILIGHCEFCSMGDGEKEALIMCVKLRKGLSD